LRIINVPTAATQQQQRQTWRRHFLGGGGFAMGWDCQWRGLGGVGGPKRDICGAVGAAICLSP